MTVSDTIIAEANVKLGEEDERKIIEELKKHAKRAGEHGQTTSQSGGNGGQASTCQTFEMGKDMSIKT